MDFVGARWHKCDFHLHTMSSECYSDNDTPEEWMAEVERKKLNCIAITDHNDYRSVDSMMTLGKEKNITVFPGVEVTCDSAKIHMLILFDVTKTQEKVRDFLNALDIDSDLIGKSDGTNMSVFDVCKKAKAKGALVIAAHIDDYSSISSMSAHNVDQLLDREYIDAVQVVNKQYWEEYLKDKDKDGLVDRIREKYGNANLSEDTIDVWRKTYDRAKKSGLPMICSSDNPRSVGNAKHGLWGIGKSYTWMKMDSTPNLESIRQAFLSEDMRIKLDVDSLEIPENFPEFWIKSLDVTDTTINAPKQTIHIDFNPQLNCIIGGRGSGKSSIIRVLTGGLDLSKRSVEGIQTEQENYYKKNVVDKKTGETQGIFKEKSAVEIQLIRNAVLYKIVASDIKSINNQNRKIYMYNEESSSWEEMEDTLYMEFMKAQIYTQKEIFEIAKAPNALLKLIDGDISGIYELKNKKKSTYDNILSKKRELINIETKLGKEARIKTELQDLESQIEIYKKTGISDLIEKKQEQDIDESQVLKLKESIEAYASQLSETIERLPFSLDSESNPFKDTILKSIFEDIAVKINENVTILRDATRSINNVPQYIDEQLGLKEWNKKKEDTLSKLESANMLLTEKGLEPTKLNQLLQEQKNKKSELDTIASLKEQYVLIKSELDALCKEYYGLFDEIRSQRTAFISTILSADDKVKIEFIAKANRESFEKMIKDSTGKDNASINEDIDKLENIVFGKGGIEKFRAIIEEIREEKENKYALSAVFRKALVAMDKEKYYEMQVFIPDDELVVSYKPDGGRKFVPLSTASAGQKTTAILTFILAYGKIPLLLDQPEDDLDNRLVYDLVVKRLKIAKTRRQIIVVTHNANIPVNGDAEYITSMDSESVYVKKKYDGTLDNAEIRKEICDVMEGSEHAFSMRAHKYHLKLSNK